MCARGLAGEGESGVARRRAWRQCAKFAGSFNSSISQSLRGMAVPSPSGAKGAPPSATLRAHAAGGGVALHTGRSAGEEEADGVTELAAARRVPLGPLATFANPNSQGLTLSSALLFRIAPFRCIALVGRDLCFNRLESNNALHDSTIMIRVIQKQTFDADEVT